MTEITFYTNPQSRGRIAHWMLEETGESYSTEWISYDGQIKSPEYLAVNPMGKVPSLKHGEAIITEVPAICAYLAASFPARGLMPAAGSSALADYYRWLFFAAGPVELMVTVKSMGWSVPEDRERSVGFGNEANVLNALELALQKGPYLCGDEFTAADVYFGSCLMWGMMFESIEKRPSFEEYVQRITARPAFAKSVELNEIQSSRQESED